MRISILNKWLKKNLLKIIASIKKVLCKHFLMMKKKSIISKT
jgi:hypothetical protein